MEQHDAKATDMTRRPLAIVSLFIIACRHSGDGLAEFRSSQVIRPWRKGSFVGERQPMYDDNIIDISDEVKARRVEG